MSKTTTLFRTVKVGEELSFDNGRVQVTLQHKTGRAAWLRLDLAEDVVVDKPRVSANDEPESNERTRARPHPS